MRLVYIPELEKLLAPGDVPLYRFTKTFQEAKDDPFLILHTSGSSGLPKPVFLPQSWVCAPDAHQRLESHDGFNPMISTFAGQRIFCCLPPFHVSSLNK
jgi:long-subunit acyl-CoA synthetase (AMP-forming)